MVTSMTETILIIDDDAAFRATLSRSFTRKGFDVASFESVEQTLSQLDTIDNAHKIIVDLKMEGESGLKLIPVLRRRFPDATILMLTGYASIATAVEAVKLGADNYLQKPAGATAILAALEKSPSTAGATDLNPAEISTPSLDRMTWEHIQRVLTDNDGNISATARQLGMHRRTLQRKLQKRPVKS